MFKSTNNYNWGRWLTLTALVFVVMLTCFLATGAGLYLLARGVAF